MQIRNLAGIYSTKFMFIFSLSLLLPLPFSRSADDRKFVRFCQAKDKMFVFIKGALHFQCSNILMKHLPELRWPSFDFPFSSYSLSLSLSHAIRYTVDVYYTFRNVYAIARNR